MTLYQHCSCHHDSSKTWQKCFFGYPVSRLFKPWWFVKTVAARGWSLFSLYIYIGNFKNLLVRNHWTIQYYLLGMFFLVTLCQDCSSHHDPSKKLGHQGRAYFPYIGNLKIFLEETTGTISIWFIRNVPLVILYQDCSSQDNSLKNMAARGQGLFSLYIYRENF